MIEHRLAKFGALRIGDLKDFRSSMHGDGEMLPGKISGAHEGTGGRVPHAHGILPRTKEERAMNEISVDGSHEGPTVRRRRGERDETHALEFSTHVHGRKLTIVGHDVAEVGTGVVRTRIE